MLFVQNIYIYTTQNKKEMIEWYGCVALCPYQTASRTALKSKTLIHPEIRNTHHTKSLTGHATPNNSQAAELPLPADREDLS